MTTNALALSPGAVARRYYMLMKPGIIYGNLLSTVGGYLLAVSVQPFVLSSLLAVVTGTALIIGAGCVFNNLTDRGIDAKMNRTKGRALVIGAITPDAALTFGVIMAVLGFMVLGLYTNSLTVTVGAVGLFFYVVMYAVAKRSTVYGTLVGSVSGAMPPVAGYTALTGQLDVTAVLLFLALVFWQMPHFYAIAMYRRKDYAAAGLPLLPLVRGDVAAKRHILAYMIGFTAVIVAMSVFALTGAVFLLVMLVACAYWLWLAVSGFRRTDNSRWARQIFGMSLLVLLTFSSLLSLEWFLP